MDHLIGLFKTVEHNFKLDDIRSTRVAFAEQAGQVAAESLEKEIEAAPAFQCPIYTEEDTPLLLVGPGQPILLGKDKKIV